MSHGGMAEMQSELTTDLGCCDSVIVSAFYNLATIFTLCIHRLYL